jgi:hypothetical protein
MKEAQSWFPSLPFGRSFNHFIHACAKTVAESAGCHHFSFPALEREKWNWSGRFERPVEVYFFAT